MKSQALAFGLPFGILLALGASATIGPARAEADIGLVFAVEGSPRIQTGSDQTSILVILQNMHDGEIISFDPGDALTVCHERSGSIFEIRGPGTIAVTRDGIARTRGAAEITKSGSCDVTVPADADGGVLLRDALSSGARR